MLNAGYSDYRLWETVVSAHCTHEPEKEELSIQLNVLLQTTPLLEKLRKTWLQRCAE